ncbi:MULTISPECIES: hypothetical protein [Cupriavidus]|jgi:hypothetical protein|uniref:hypothetical protein n=1 Tax=Cupriavidus TaxID=106589 RepID=UPI0004677811|nr:hypothetical protein [Cupriavidus metallidurans]KWW32426.1 hypothetical protein AU374_06026 [Cupriavidus metallidurans]
MRKIERLTVRANYTVTKDGKETTGQVEFIARVADSSKGYGLEQRARNAVSRRVGVPASSVRIIGVISF